MLFCCSCVPLVFFFSVIRKFAVNILPEMKIIYTPVQFNWRWSLLHCLNLYEVFALLYLYCCTEDPSSQVRSSFSTDVAPRQKKKKDMRISMSMNSVILHIVCSFVFVPGRLDNRQLLETGYDLERITEEYLVFNRSD